MSNLNITDDGADVILTSGKITLRLPPDVARLVAKHLVAKAARVEETQNVARVVLDQAILHRANTGIGISSNPKILDAAKHEAQWDRDLRRYMPLKGIEPKAVVGIPTLRKG